MWSHRCVIARIALTFALAATATVMSVQATPAAAGVETCHGRPATIVGEPGGEIEGTDGADVVVTNGAARTLTGDGDDLVCVTGGTPDDDSDTQVGDGDDVVDTTASLAIRNHAYLGEGDDTFTGGAGPDDVSASAPFSKSQGEGSDVVVTGGGADFVQTGGSQSHPDHDTIDVGAGRDDVFVQGPVDPAFTIAGGTGADRLLLDRIAVRHALVLDNVRERATDAGVTVMTWSSFQRFDLSHIGPYEPPSFIGGPQAERVSAFIPLASVDLGGGDDVLNLEYQERLVARPDFVGGPGTDALVLDSGAGDQAQRVDLDVPDRRLFFRREQGAQMRARISSFEVYRLSADRLDVRGSRGPDVVEWVGCRGVVDGRGGDDVLEETSIADVGCGYLDERGHEIVRGGAGDDVLLGGSAPNVLIGGAGDDVADGGGSKRDRCVAETERRCEL